METDAVLTVPNVLSLLRLLALPFIYLDLASGRLVRAFVVLSVVVWTDYVDGYVARRFGQVSRIGRLADPVSDRLLVAAVGAGMVVGDIIPLWVLLALVARDVVIIIGGLELMRRGMTPPTVTDVGKSATFGIMGALPLFVLAGILDSEHLRDSSWVILGASGFLYYVAFVQYAVVITRSVRRSS